MNKMKVSAEGGNPMYCVMSCMRVCRKQALSRVKYYYYATISKIQQATIMTV